MKQVEGGGQEATRKAYVYTARTKTRGIESITLRLIDK